MKTRNLILILPLILLACHPQTEADKAADEAQAFATYIAAHGQAPTDYIVNKFRTHYVISLGEDHWVNDDPSTAGPYRRTALLPDDIDAILFFRPIEQFSGSTVYAPFFDDAFVRRVSMRKQGTVKTRADILRYIRQNHPILSDGIDALLGSK